MLSKKEHIIKTLLFGAIVLLLWIPMIQQNILFYEERPLKGAIVAKEKPQLTINNWFSGKYQDSLNSFLNQHFGFRNTLVRLNNQKIYNLYNIAKANGVIIGKENYLYEENYIKAYLGTDFIGEKQIISHVEKLKVVQDSLKKLNKDIIFILAPGKGSFFSEYIPDNYLSQKQDSTNYSYLLKHFKVNGINHIDFNKWFRDNKGKKPYPLYAKAGIHWSKYSELIVADSILSYIENLRKTKLPDIIIDSTYLSDKNLYEDYDIGDGMNLLFDLPTYPMAYSSFHYNKANADTSLNLLVVADSYYWGIYNYGIPNTVFKHNTFWYYNKEIYHADGTVKSIYEVDLEQEINKTDVILLLFTDANLHNFDYGFTNNLYNSVLGNKEVFNEKLNHYIQAIKNNAEWLNSVKKQAKEQNKPLDKMILENAEYMVNQEIEK